MAGGLPRSIATVCLSGTLPEKLEAAASVGFDGVEIFENDLLTFDGSPADVRRIAGDLGLAITLFQPFRDFEAMPDPVRARNLDRAERKFDVMAALGTDLVLVCSNVQPIALDDPARAAADLREMAERASRRDLRICYEALAWGTHVNRWRQAWDIVARADHPALGLCVDSFHTLAVGDTADGVTDVPAEKLFFLQLADAPRLAMDVLSWSRHFRNFPGQGDLDVAGVLRSMLQAGYRGPMSLEIFNDEFRAAPPKRTALDGLRSLILVEAEAGGRPIPPMPALGWPASGGPASGAIEFLEFAVDETAARELAGFLGVLGFRHAGRHRSKAVELYRQGGVNLVLNSEQDSAASEHFQLHGPSVCALALRVDDAAGALARAEALLCAPWQQPRGVGERHIPSIRAPDGMLIYLVEPGPSGRTLYDDDFLLEPATEIAGPELLRGADHLALAVPPGRIDEFVLFWRAVFGLETGAANDLPDPHGLIKSRPLASPDRALRLVLNASESRDTATSRFIQAASGGGIHHLAFDTPAIGPAIAAVARQGDLLLRVADNYYDDVAARFGLDDARIAELRSQGLLYDQAGEGEFLHAYTVSFQNRFFFEILERRGGYDGYGAANAATRLAAQLRRASR